MSGGNKVVGLWSGTEADRHDVTDPGDRLVEASTAPPMVEWHDDEDAQTSSSSWRSRMPTVIAVIAALAWIGTVTWERYLVIGTAFGLSDVTSLIAGSSAPLALIAVLWLLAQRSSRAEERRFAATSKLIDTEADRLQALFALINTRIADGRASLAEESERMLALGEEASARLQATSKAMTSEIETIHRNTNLLTTSTSSARGDLAVLLSSLPKANVQMRDMTVALQNASLSAHEQAGALDAQLALLSTRGREADETAGNAAQRLAAHLARMESVSEVAGKRLEDVAAQMTEAVDAALDRAAEALDTSRQGMEAQGAAMMALISQNQSAMARAGDEAAIALQDRIAIISKRIEAITASFAAHDQQADQLVARLRDDLADAETRFGALETQGSARIERLGTAIAALRDHSDDMARALSESGDGANALVERAQSLMTALDAVQREVDDVLPASFAKLEATARQSTQVLAETSPNITATNDKAAQAIAQLVEIGGLLARHRADVDAIAALGEQALASSATAAERITAQTAEADRNITGLHQTAIPALNAALDQVKAGTQTTAQETEAALNAAVIRATETVGARTRDAVTDALTRQMETQLAKIVETTQTAVATAQGATDRLMRQMLTISETSAALEARIADAKADIERSDQGNFARRVALLIESLNSTAIDVTKILSNEVTDTAWASYLRGDRGVFSRRAVKLIDTTQAKEIAQHYENEPEFREQVNRYIHDFESMLRHVLATRDGSLLGVTLLSSDNGKLYVALAQAIERLRT
jgi:hypothetical protein